MRSWDPVLRKGIFAPFFTTRPRERGTALGLPSVYGIAQLNERLVGGYSGLGRRPTFKIYLPITREKLMIEQNQAGGGRDLSDSRETILVVEDEDAVRALIKDILERVGYNVLSAGTPEAAEKIFKEHYEEIELLLSDVVMPGKNGPELYNVLAQQKPALFVLFISGYSEEGVFDQINPAHESGFIQKPFRPTDLIHKVREILDQ